MTAPKLDLAYFVGWLATGERGSSSETIVATLTGEKIGRYGTNKDHPYDPADLRRCMKLLDAYPLARHHFKDAVRGVSPTWELMVDGWGEMESLLREEMASSKDGTAPKTYALMQELRGQCPKCSQYPKWCHCEPEENQ